MCTFSAIVYPASWMISMRSRSGGGMVSSWLAVQMNITLLRSNGRSR